MNSVFRAKQDGSSTVTESSHDGLTGSHDGARPASPVSSVTRRLLLVDDHPDNRAIVLAYLKSTPFEVTTAENGRAALEAVQATVFDVVLMDLQMPVMDGYESTRRIRAWEREAGRSPVPILALTANAMKEERERTLRAGCDRHLTKPVRKQTLLHALDEIRPVCAPGAEWHGPCDDLV